MGCVSKGVLTAGFALVGQKWCFIFRKVIKINQICFAEIRFLQISRNINLRQLNVSKKKKERGSQKGCI